MPPPDSPPDAGGATSKVEFIEAILKRHSPLTAVDICRELLVVGIDARPGNVRSLLAISFNRFVSLTPGLWQLQDPAMSRVDRVILYERSRGRVLKPEGQGHPGGRRQGQSFQGTTCSTKGGWRQEAQGCGRQGAQG